MSRMRPMQLPGLPGERAVLVVAHPGHELRVHGWLELARPQVWVLTDGSGHGASSRLASTSAVLARAGARPGSIYGRLSDRAAYAMILDGDDAAVFALVEELAEALLASAGSASSAGSVSSTGWTARLDFFIR